MGAGCSMNREYALDRALSELLQALEFMFAYPDDEEPKKLLHLAGNLLALPRYRACMQLRSSRSLVDIEPTCYYDQVVEYPGLSHAKECFEALIGRLTELGRDVFESINYASKVSDVRVAHYLVPGLERFHLVRSGHLVLPSERGLAQIA